MSNKKTSKQLLDAVRIGSTIKIAIFDLLCHKRTDIQLKGKERKLVYTAKKTQLQDYLSISSIIISTTSSNKNKQTSSQLNPN